MQAQGGAKRRASEVRFPKPCHWFIQQIHIESVVLGRPREGRNKETLDETCSPELTGQWVRGGRKCHEDLGFGDNQELPTRLSLFRSLYYQYSGP